MQHLRKALLAGSVCVALGGCQTVSMPPPPGVFQQAMMECGQQTNDDSLQMSCLQKHRSAPMYTPAEAELVAFGAMTMERKAQGKITGAEADYLMLRQTNAMSQQEAAVEDRKVAQAAVTRAQIGERLGNLSRALQARDAPGNYPRTTHTSCSVFMNSLDCTSQ
jgi:hypothetical protein